MSIYDSLIPDISARQLEDVMTECDKRDLTAMNLHMDYYRNEVKPAHPQSMSEETFRDRVASWVGVPLASLLVNTIGAALYNRDVSRTTGNEAFDKALEGVWSTMRQTMLQNARLASVIGDTVIRISPDWRAGLRLSVWDGRHIVPIYNPDDPQEVIGIIYDYIADTAQSQIARALRGQGHAEERIEIVTRHIRNPMTGAIEQPGIRARFIDGKRVPWTDDSAVDGFNPLGDFLDGVFWRNSLDPTATRGMSDLAHMIPMLASINEETTDAELLLRWNVYPIIWTTAEVEEAPDYSHKALWALGERSNGQPGEAGMLEWSGNLDGFRTHFDHLLGLLHETARVPAIATGDLTHIGELSSGRAYEIAMRPYLDLISERERLCEVQELDLMRSMIALLAYMGKAPFTGLTQNYGLGFDQPDPLKIDKATETADIEYEPIRLAEDETQEAMAHSTRIGAGFESIETAIRETHPDWTDDDIREELERVGSGAATVTDASADLRIQQQQEELKARASSTARPTP